MSATDDAREGGYVLLAEDDAAIAEMYRLQLEMDGRKVKVVTDGLAAIEAIELETPSVLFLDMRMPKLDGMQVLAVLKAEDLTERIPTAMLSSYSDRDLADEATSLGAIEWLVKAQTEPRKLSQFVSDCLARERGISA